MRKKFLVFLLVGVFLSVFLLPLTSEGVKAQTQIIKPPEIQNLEISENGADVIGGKIIFTIQIDQGEESASITLPKITLRRSDYPQLLKDADLRMDYNIEFKRGTPFALGKVYKGAIIQKTSPPDGYGKIRYYPFIAVAPSKWESIYVPYKIKITTSDGKIVKDNILVISGYPYRDDKVTLVSGMELSRIKKISEGFKFPPADRGIIVIEKAGKPEKITTTLESIESKSKYYDDAWTTEGLSLRFSSFFRLHVTPGDKGNEEFDGLRILDEYGNVLLARGVFANESHPIEGVDKPCDWSSTMYLGVGDRGVEIDLVDLGGGLVTGEDDDTKDKNHPLKIIVGKEIGDWNAFKIGFFGNWFGGDDKHRPNWEIRTKLEVLGKNKYDWTPVDTGYPLYAKTTLGAVYCSEGTLYAKLDDFLEGDKNGVLSGGGAYDLKPLSEGNARWARIFRKQTRLNTLKDVGDLGKFVWAEVISSRLDDIAQEGWNELSRLTGYKLLTYSPYFTDLSIAELPEISGTEWADFSIGMGYIDSGAFMLFTLNETWDIETGVSPEVVLSLDASKYCKIVYTGGVGKPEVQDNMNITLYGGRLNTGFIKVKNIGLAKDTFKISFKLTSVPSGVAISCSPATVDLDAGQEEMVALTFDVSDVPLALENSRWEGKVTVTAIGTNLTAEASVGGVLKRWTPPPVTYTAYVTVRVRLIRPEGTFFANAYEVTIGGKTVTGFGSEGAKFTLTLYQESEVISIYVKVLNPSGLIDKTVSKVISAGTNIIDIDYVETYGDPQVWDNMNIILYGGKPAYFNTGGIRVKNIGAGRDTFTIVFETTYVPSGITIISSPLSVELDAGEERVIVLQFSVSQIPRELDGSYWEGKVTVTASTSGKRAIGRVGGTLKYWEAAPVYTAEVTVRVRLLEEEGVFFAEQYLVTIGAQMAMGMGSEGAKFTLFLQQEVQTFDVHVKVLVPSGLPEKTKTITVVKGTSQTVDIDYDLRPAPAPAVSPYLLPALVGGTMTVAGSGGTYYATKRRRI